MVVFHGFDALRPLRRPPAVAVGNFDGLHLGHQKILAQLCALARARNLAPLVLTFEPHPERALGKKTVRMIDSPDQRLARLKGSCVEAVLVTRFDRSLSGLTAREFVERVLHNRLGAREVVIGRDFRFGHDRRGDISLLRREGRRLGFGVRAVPPRLVGGLPVSSSRIRQLLERGRVEEAARLLGRPYEIAGKVRAGASRGRRLGAPTANLKTDNEILPDGVYVSETVWKGRAWPSVTSIGTNPTFGRHPTSVETHVLDRQVDFRGAAIIVRLLRRLRPTRKFSGAGTLAAQIRRDVASARAYFARSG